MERESLKVFGNCGISEVRRRDVKTGFRRVLIVRCSPRVLQVENKFDNSYNALDQLGIHG